MSQKIVIAPSLQALNHFDYGLALKALVACNIQAFHIDVMDATCTNTIGLNPNVVQVAQKLANCTFDFHIMSANPIRLLKTIPVVAKSYVHTHFRMVADYQQFVNACLQNQLTPGLTVDLDTDLTRIAQIVNQVPFVNFMAVRKIGLTNQQLDHFVFKQIDEFVSLYGNKHTIAIDGSIRYEHLPAVRKRVNYLVVGSLLYQFADYQAGINHILQGLAG